MYSDIPTQFSMLFLIPFWQGTENFKFPSTSKFVTPYWAHYIRHTAGTVFSRGKHVALIPPQAATSVDDSEWEATRE